MSPHRERKRRRAKDRRRQRFKTYSRVSVRYGAYEALFRGRQVAERIYRGLHGFRARHIDLEGLTWHLRPVYHRVIPSIGVLDVG